MSMLALLSTADTSWRAERPFLGGVLLIVSGLIVGYVPIQFTLELILMGTPLAAIGMLFAVLLFLTGVFALLRPDQSTNLGIAGVAFSILSVVGALGGLLVGLLIGIVGSNLLISWEPPGSQREEYATATTASAGGGSGWQDTVGGAGTTAPTAGSSGSATTGGGGQKFSWMDDHTTSQSGSGTTQMDTMDRTQERGTSSGTVTGTTGDTDFEYQEESATDTGPDTGTTGGSVTGSTEGPDTGTTGGPDTGTTGGPDRGTGRSDEGSVDFSWQEDPQARSGSHQEDVGTGFQAERESTMDDEEDEDEDEDDDGSVDFSWSDD